MDKRILGLVTARGGSERIPKKSIALLAGHPMMAYVLDAMKRARSVNRIIVDTDDEEMAAVGRENGGEIPYLRPKELAQDSTGHVPVLKHALEFLKEKEGYWPDAVVLVQPTSPLVVPRHIDDTVALLFESGVDSVETVFKAPTVFHPYNLRVIDEKGFTRFLMPEERAQAAKAGKRPPVYVIGTVYAFRPDNLWKYGTIQGEKSKSVIIDRASGIDVDEPLDLAIAEAILVKGLDK